MRGYVKLDGGVDSGAGWFSRSMSHANGLRAPVECFYLSSGVIQGKLQTIQSRISALIAPSSLSRAVLPERRPTGGYPCSI
jgi:hypothetical protein